MLNLHNLAPVLDVALSPTGLRDLEILPSALAAGGWTSGPVEHVDTGEQRHWRAPGSALVDVLSASAWTTAARGEGISFGLIVEASSESSARILRDAIHDRIATEKGFASIESDDVWSNWSDGEHIVRLAVHRSSTVGDKVIPPSVQVSFEPAGPTLPKH